MYLDIHGARGSMPVGSLDFGRYGGDTTCYSLHHDDGSLIAVIDAGTGLRRLGTRLADSTQPVTFLMTHYHWDHIQGLSMLSPMWKGDMSLRILGPGDPATSLAPAIAPPWFPVSIADVDVVFGTAPLSFSIDEVEVHTFPLCHPQGGFGYRFDHDGASVVIATDHEAGSDADRTMVEVAKGADLLVCDAQYLPGEIESKRGWGHSTWEQATHLARTTEARTLVLASHDPSRSDRGVDDIVDASVSVFPRTMAAESGSRIQIGG